MRIGRVKPTAAEFATHRTDQPPRVGLEVQAESFRRHFDDPIELVGRGRSDEDLVLDPPEERVVAELGRVEVRREDDQDLERNGELQAAVEREIVDATFQGHDPPVQQRSRLDELTAEVVDQEDAVVRLHLQRRGVHLGGRIPLQLEHREFELATGDHHRPFTDDPPRVEALGLALHRCVDRRVEDGDDGAVDLDGVRDNDPVVVEADQTFGQRRLPGARRAVEEDGLLRRERRTDSVDRLLGDDEITERRVDDRRVDIDLRPQLRADLLIERHAHRSDAAVGAAAERRLRPITPAFGQGEVVVVALQFEHVEVLARTKIFEDRSNDDRRHADLPSEAGNARTFGPQPAAQEQVLDHLDIDVELSDRRRRTEVRWDQALDVHCRCCRPVPGPP